MFQPAPSRWVVTSVLAVAALAASIELWADASPGNVSTQPASQFSTSADRPFEQIGNVKGVSLSLVWLQGRFFAADGHTFATESTRSQVMLWDARTAKLISKPIDAKVSAFCLTADGRRLFTGADGEVCVWDVATSTRSAVAHVQKGQMNCLDAPSDGSRFLVVADEDPTVITVWNASSERPTELYQHKYPHEILWTQFDPTGTYIIAEELSGPAHLFRAASGRDVCPPIETQNEPMSSTVYSAQFDPAGRRVVVPLENGFKVLQSDSGKMTTSSHLGDRFAPRQLSFSGDGSLLAVATWNQPDDNIGRPVFVFDAATARLVRKFGSMSRISTCQIAAGGRWALCNHTNSAPEVWDLSTGVAVETLSVAGERAGDALMSPDGRTILLNSFSSDTISVWRFRAPLTQP